MKSLFKIEALITLLVFLSFSLNIFSQVSITETSSTVVIDFSNTMQTTVGTSPSTVYTGAGFSPNPTISGRLNSNAWSITGFSYGSLPFGGTQTLDVFGRGSVSSGVVTSGIYAYTDAPNSVANPALLIQPAATSFAPGTITLRVKNSGTSNLTQLQVSYNLYVRNDENRSNSFNFSHSLDDVVYQSVTALDYTSPEASDALQWVSIGVTPSRSTIISGLNIAPGAFYYLRWSSNDVSGSGSRDEFGLDDIVITGTYGPPAPEINVTGYGTSILSGSTITLVSNGTDFAPITSPISTLNATQTITYNIQNLGGALLNVSSIVIGGLNPSDFTLFIPGLANLPTGDIQPVSGGVISFRELSITFDPSASGLRKAIVYIYNNDSDENPYIFHIQGYGFDPVPEITLSGLTGGISQIVCNSLIPSTFNNTLFAQQVVGVTSQIKDYKIKNDGTAQLLLTASSPFVTIGGNNPSDFTLETIPTSGVINPGFTRNFSIKFSPTAPGIRSALVTIPNNDSDENPYVFLIQGTGVTPEIDIVGNNQPIVSGSLQPTIVNHTSFDYQSISSGFLERTYTVKNIGTTVLSIGAVSIMGLHASDFTLISSPASTVAINNSTTFIIRFSPTAVGLRSAIVSIVNDDIDENPYTFAISGIGIDYINCSFGVTETLASQDFELVPSSPLWSYSATGGFSVTNGVAFAALGDSGLTNRFIGSRSFQVNNSTANITMSNIDTSNFSDIELNLRVAAMALTNVQGLDVTTDKVLVAISTNNGVSWSNEIEVIGRSNSVWSFTSGVATATKAYTGTNSILTNGPINAPSSSINYQTTEGFSMIKLTNLPRVTSLSVRITIVNNDPSELWVIDDVALIGRRELFSIWNGLNWSNGIPLANVKAVINSDYNTSLQGSIRACKCEINSGKKLTIAPNTFLKIESDLVNNGSLIIENGGSLVQRNDFASNVGLINLKRFTVPMRKFDYTYWSSPVLGQSLFNLSPLTLSDKYFHFNTAFNNWQILSGSSVMTPGKGYIIRAPQTFSATTPLVYTDGQFIGVPNNGFIQLPIVVGESNWNLIGNPYPSAIDADSFLGYYENTGVIEGTIYLWTHNTPITNNVYSSSDYAVYNILGGVGTAASTTGNSTIPSGKIASGQGFFVKAIANGQVKFNNSMRITDNNNEFFRNSNIIFNDNEYQEFEKNRIWLNLQNSQGAFKQILVGYAENATNGIDRDFDGAVLSSDNVISFYSICDNHSLSIQGRVFPFEVDDVVQLGYISTVSGDFSIMIENYDGIFNNQNIYLRDKLLNIDHDLKSMPYAFGSTSGTFNDRFEIRYTSALLNSLSYANKDEIVVISKDRKIEIFSSLDKIMSINVFDVLGREIVDVNNVNSRDFEIKTELLNRQSIILKIKLENGKLYYKKLLLQ
jgi:hypothetical protein